MITLDKALDIVMELPPDERELLLDIVQRRQIEVRRAEIALNAREARALLEAGKLKVEPLDEALARLHASLDEQNLDEADA